MTSRDDFYRSTSCYLHFRSAWIRRSAGADVVHLRKRQEIDNDTATHILPNSLVLLQSCTDLIIISYAYCRQQVDFVVCVDVVGLVGDVAHAHDKRLHPRRLIAVGQHRTANKITGKVEDTAFATRLCEKKMRFVLTQPDHKINAKLYHTHVRAYLASSTENA